MWFSINFCVFLLCCAEIANLALIYEKQWIFDRFFEVEKMVLGTNFRRDKSFFGISKAFSDPQNAHIASIRHTVCHRSLMNLRLSRIDWVLGRSIYFSIDFLKSKKWFLTKNFGEIKVLFRLEDCFLGLRMRIWYLEKNYEIAFRGGNSEYMP